MSFQLSAAQIIADSIIECIQKRLGTCDILIVGVWDFDVNRIVSRLGQLKQNNHPIRLVIDGFGDKQELIEIARNAGFTIPDEFDSELKMAGKWRNEWDDDQGTRIAIARNLPKRMNTLGQFVTISSTEVAKQMLIWAATSQDFYMNQPHRHLFEVLQNEDDFAGQHIPHLIANYLAALAAKKPTDRLTAAFQELWRLKLLPDTNLFSGPGTIESRLSQNQDLIKQIQAADQIHRSLINSSLAQLSGSERANIEKTLQTISDYQRSFDTKFLANLTLDSVIDALDPRRVRERLKKGKGQTNDGPDGGDATSGGEENNQGSDNASGKSSNTLNRKQFDRRFGEHILQGDNDAAEDMTNALNNSIVNRSAKEEKGSLHFYIEEQEVSFRIDERLLDFVRMVCSDEHFGGTFKTKEGTLRAAIDRLEIAEDIKFYNPGKSLSGEEYTSISELIEQFDRRFPEIGFNDALGNFSTCRAELLPFLDILTIDPFVAIIPSHLELFENYLSASNKLMDLIRSKYDDMREASEVSLQMCLSQLLALDTVLVKCGSNNQETLKAILMPLHPMYLWPFVELVKIGDRIRTDADCTDEDRLAYLNEMTQERFFLNALYFTEFITGGTTVTLPLAGSIELLACYENTSNHYSGIDGLDNLFSVIEHFCYQYRILIRPLRISIIDVPSVDEVLIRMNTLLNKIRRKELPSVQLNLYFTSTGAARNYISSMLSPENEQIYQDLIASGRMQLYLSPVNNTLKEVITLFKETPVHILALFDQSNVQQRGFTRTVEFNTSPLCITREFKHDEFRDVITARPVTNAPLFAAYDDFVRKLKNELTNHSMGVVADASTLRSTIEQSLSDECTQWLFLADRALPSESNLQAARLLAQSANRRQTLTLAKSLDSFARPLKDLLHRYNLYVPTPEALVGLMQDFTHLISEGLLALSNRNGLFDENRQKGLLGMLLTARDYRSQYPDSVIVSVDSPTAKQWLRISSEGREMRADLLGLRTTDNKFIVDVIEVKTHEGPLFEEMVELEKEAFSKAIDQVSKTISALKKVFVQTLDGEADPPLVPPRREVLRELFFQEIQSRRYTKDFRLLWVPQLNEFFQPQSANRVEIYGHVYEIALSKDIETREHILRIPSSVELTHVILGTVRIQRLLDERIGIEKSSLTDEIRRVATESLQTQASIRQSSESSPEKVEETVIKTPQNIIPGTMQTGDEIAVDNKWLKRVSYLFERACGNFGIQVIDCDPNQAVVGPSVVRFRFKIAEGQSRRKLDQNIEDIGREISISNILVRKLPDTNYLALDVPSPNRQSHSLIKDGLIHLPSINTIEQMPLLIGQSPSGEVIINDLAEMVHILVGGSTRSGKTIFLYSVILSLLAKHPSKETLELMLCTAKPEDFVFFEKLPHLHNRPVIEDTKEAINEIRQISSVVLPERSQILRDARVTSVASYNQEREIKNQLRPIIIIVDEFADLGDQVHDDRKMKDLFYTSIRQIAQAGRSRSVHLVLCTQRPTADLFPSNVKSQMNARIALKVNSSIDSNVILGQNGAEMLLGKGDMLFKYNEILERIQGYYCSPDDIEVFLKGL